MNNDYLLVVSFFGFIVSIFLLVVNLPIIFWFVGAFLLVVFGPLFCYSIVRDLKKKPKTEVEH